MADRPITSAQVRSIHIALSRQGIDDATYRGILYERYGVETCKALTRRQASELLARLGRPLKRAPPERSRAPRPDPLPEGATRLATREQRGLIAELAAEVEWREPDGYAEWLKANMGLKRIATAAQAARIINGLMAMVRRAQH